MQRFISNVNLLNIKLICVENTFGRHLAILITKYICIVYVNFVTQNWTTRGQFRQLDSGSLSFADISVGSLHNTYFLC